jgi:O-acetyl-ADP-ribose deacetylase (regulator of RNase III)
MLHEVSGDILLSRAHVLAHGVAPGDHFDSGLALALRERWPAMVKDFRHFCRVSRAAPGSLWTWGGPGGVRIVNLLTQAPPRTQGARPGGARVSYVHRALKALASEIERQGWSSVALPRLATGVGRLSWDDVRPLLERHLGGLGIPVIVYTEYRPGVAAPEPLGS